MMSVLIRLQGLPCSADETDIRQFFRGLRISERGVHIVGGKNGDAFVAFASDEDARQAMRMDGKRLFASLPLSQIKLYLSSRVEMQKIIEKARGDLTQPESVIDFDK